MSEQVIKDVNISYIYSKWDTTQKTKFTKKTKNAFKCKSEIFIIQIIVVIKIKIL